MFYSQDVSGLAVGFIHKRIIGAVGGFIGGGAGGAVKGFIGGGGGGGGATGGRQEKARQALERTRMAGPPATPGRPRNSDCWSWTGTRWGWDCATGQLSRGGTFQALPMQGFAGQDCQWPKRWDTRTQSCKIFLGDVSGPDPRNGSAAGSQAVAGAFGMPAMVPVAEPRTRLTCPPGMVLGEDDLCYPKAILRRDSRFRKWRPGRRPVLTGGDLNAISRARRAVTRARGAVSSLGVTVKKK